MRRALALLVLLLLLPIAAQAQTRVGVRLGDHPGHGRVVFDWPDRTGYAVEEAEGRAVLRFAAPALFDLPATRRAARNLRGIAAEGGTVTIEFAPGTRLRHFRLGNRVVVDLLDAEATPAALRTEPRPQAAPARAEPRPAPAARTEPRAPAARPARTTPEAAPPPEPPAVIAPPATSPVVAEPLQASATIPAPADVGAALLRRGGAWLLVLDADLPVALVALDSGGFGGAERIESTHGTVLRLAVPGGREPRLTRRRDGWLLETAETVPEPRELRAEMDPGPPPRLVLRSERAAATLAVLDPETGGTLLVGTLRQEGEGTPRPRRAATFEILPTRLGAAILPRADTVTLRALGAGFVAAAEPGTDLALGAEPPAESEAATLTRSFDLPPEPLPALIQRERNATLAVAAAPPLGRGPPRLRNAEALLALGLGAEAQAMAVLAMREDPRLAQDPLAHALHGAAALLAGRPAEAEGLLHPRLEPTDEVTLWRGLLAAARGEDGAARIAAGVPLLRAWPEPLRQRLAPIAAEILAGSRETAAARRLLSGREADPGYAVARARLRESDGEAEAALAAYEAIARGRDRRARAVAMRRAAELRLASGALDAAGAASAMEGVLAAWRGDAMGRDARLRLAELRMQAGQPRAAFEALRETAEAFPQGADTLRPRQVEALLAAITAEPPIQAVALFDAHVAMLPSGEQTERALAALAERLAALDLVDRARAVLGRALARAGSAEAEARVGLRLANLALGAGDAEGARAALARTEAAGLPEALRRERLRSEARALARLDRIAEATSRYREAGPEAGGELAELLAARQAWPEAAAAMLSHLAFALPAPPLPLDAEAQRLVARAAALLALAGDAPGLAALQAAEGPRMAGSAFEDAFALMTAGRIGGISDLPRLRRELEVARLLPSRLESLRAGAVSTR